MTIAIVSLVDATTRRATPGSLQLPRFASIVFTGLHKVHRLWRWYRKADVYSNPDNFAGLLAGHAVNFLVGDALVLRVAAQCVFIATRILECVQQQALVCRAFRKCIDAFCGTYVVTPKIQWVKKSATSLGSSCFSAYSINWQRQFFRTLGYRIKWIACSILQLFTEIFKLSMRIMDAIESFSLSPRTRNESINEFFVNGTRCMDVLVQNKQCLLKSLIDNKPIIADILQGVNPAYKVEHLIATVSGAIDKTEMVSKGIKKVSRLWGGFFVNLLKNGVFSFMSTLGVSEYTPKYLLPAPDTPVEEILAIRVRQQR